MANKRNLKKNIKNVCTSLFAECVAVSLYATDNKKIYLAPLFFSILKLEDNYLKRVSHVEPGMKAKDYFKDLKTRFISEVTEITDQINALYS